jgi:hypothetical protein
MYSWLKKVFPFPKVQKCLRERLAVVAHPSTTFENCELRAHHASSIFSASDTVMFCAITMDHGTSIRNDETCHEVYNVENNSTVPVLQLQH